MARPLFDSPTIYGLHDPGGEQILLDAGRSGWILFTEEIGQDPADESGRDYRAYSSQNLGVIVRLNHGYFPRGTIPTSDRYAEFAQRCANFVANSLGAKIWIIGNEMNYDIERPRYSAQPALDAETEASVKDITYGELTREGWNAFLQMISGGMGDAELGRPVPPVTPPVARPPQASPVPPDPDDPFYQSLPTRFSALRTEAEADADNETAQLATPSYVEVITPQKYADCFRRCREAILSVPGHASDQVLVGAVAPWNNQTSYPGNERGDWVAYLTDTLELLGPDGLDGVALHTYTHQADRNLIYDERKMDPPFTDRHYEFRAYRDFMAGIPEAMRHLPVYITETNQDVTWLNQNIGWVQAAYGEINYWNEQPGNQQIRALILYRWPRIDMWYIEGKEGVIEDFRQSLPPDYTWTASVPPPADYGEGDILATRDIVNLRRTPGYFNQAPGDVIVALPEGTLVRVTADAYAEADGLTWWSVGSAEQNIQGWMAQSDPQGIPLVRLVERRISGGPDGELGVGSLAVTLTTVRLRKSPGYVGKPPDDTIMAVAPDTSVAVADGPATMDGLTWWEVRGLESDGTLFAGWMAETAPNGVRLLEETGEIERPDIGLPSIDDDKFAVGDQVVTLDFVRFRRTPGYVDKQPDDVLADLLPGAAGPVLDGPRRRDELVWWQLRMPLPDGGNADGWAAESAPNGVELLALDDEGGSGQIGAFAPGDAAMTQDVVRFRMTPGYVDKEASDIIADVPTGTVVTVMAGPETKDELVWWQVDAPVSGQMKRGWMAETAPSGATLLAPFDGTLPGTGDYQPGELIQAATAVRVRRTPGTEGKPADDVLGDFEPLATLNVIEGPVSQDGLSWYRVGGISLRVAEVVGWVAEVAPNGVRLLQRAPKLPGTDIPNLSMGLALAMPFRGDFGIAQLWAENPPIYGEIHYDGVPLKGHNGIDFLTPTGTDLQAVDDGVVAEAVYEDPSGLGNYVLVHHAWGESIYAHLNDIGVVTGQAVSRGQLLGHSGSTGFSNGPHLHFAIRINPYVRTDGWGGYSDPLPYLPRTAVHLPDYVLPPEQRRPVPQGQAISPGHTPLPASFAPGMAPDRPGVRRP